MHRPAPRRLSGVVLAVLLAAAACTDRNPASAPGAAPATPPPLALATLACTVSVRDGTLACAAPEAAAPAGVSAAVIGGQGTNVQLTSTGESYDGTSVFRADVTVANLMAQALGTSDGMNPSAEGVRVFFGSGPVATEGTGAVEVANADGEGFFTTAAQKFFRYDGILAPGGVSAAKEWRFTVPSTVASFTFGVYVAAPVPAEQGFLSLYPIAPSLRVGQTREMRATLRNVAGAELGGQPVSWTTSSAAVAAVDSLGVITGGQAGTATVTASSGGRTASVRVVVYDSDPGITTIYGLRAARSAATAGRDTLSFWWEYIPLPGVGGAEIVLRHPDGAERRCNVLFTPCRVPLAEGTLGGAWRIERAIIGTRGISHEELLAAGVPAHVYVESANEDRTSPTVDSLALAPAAVTPADTVRLTVVATDDAVGVERAEAWVSSPGNPQMRWPSRRSAAGAGGTRVLYFEERIPSYAAGGTFTLDSVRVQDYNLNRRTLSTAEIAAQGYPTQFTLTGTSADTVPPTITAFTFSPDTLVGNGTVPVTVTLSASEPAGASGVWFLDMEFEKVNDFTQLRRCHLNGATRVLARTMTCSLSFGAADVGAWRVRYIRAIDYVNNERLLYLEDVQAAGYPTRLVVTGETPDVTAPVITGFTFSPRTVAGNGVDSVRVTLSASEPAGESGMWYMDVSFEKVSDTSQRRRCVLNDPGARDALTLACGVSFGAADAGAWRVRYVRAIDVMNNARVLFTAQVQAAGYPTELTVTPP
jgi:hypothetical protein